MDLEWAELRAEVIKFKKICQRFPTSTTIDETERNYRENQWSADYTKFWLDKSSEFPILSKIALSVNALAPSTSLVDSSFLKTNEYRSDKRNRLSTKRTDDTLCLYYYQIFSLL